MKFLTLIIYIPKYTKSIPTPSKIVKAIGIKDRPIAIFLDIAEDTDRKDREPDLYHTRPEGDVGP